MKCLKLGSLRSQAQGSRGQGHPTDNYDWSVCKNILITYDKHDKCHASLNIAQSDGFWIPDSAHVT